MCIYIYIMYKYHFYHGMIILLNYVLHVSPWKSNAFPHMKQPSKKPWLSRGWNHIFQTRNYGVLLYELGIDGIWMMTQ